MPPIVDSTLGFLRISLISMRLASYHTNRPTSSAIFVISVLGLFVELMLIRWIGTEIRIFAYLQNTVLVVCFLGLGLGCFSCEREIKLAHTLLGLFLLALLLSIPQTQTLLLGISSMLGSLSDIVIWNQQFASSPTQTALSVLFGLCLTYALMLLLFQIFLPIGRILGRVMNAHPRPIFAYSVNVLGSLIGIWLFVLLSALQLGPVIWLTVSFLLILYFVDFSSSSRNALALISIATVLLANFAGYRLRDSQVVWSPYQKLAVFSSPPPLFLEPGTHAINVNNTGYQALQNLSAEYVSARPQVFAPELKGYSQYDIPLLLHPKPDKVLLVGSGSGNDVAGALRNGAKEITAVEIDPAIVELGRKLHPEDPYSDARVKVVVDDARSFFATTTDKFDLISFGILDAHTSNSMTNARLDHYVYTKQSLQRARDLLKPGGLIALNFVVRRDFIAQRMIAALSEVFDRPPFSFTIPESPYNWGGVMFVAGDLGAVRSQIQDNPGLRNLIEKWQSEFPVPAARQIEITSDDWPYIYLPGRYIPVLYYFLALLLLLLLQHAKSQGVLLSSEFKWSKQSWHFFFLGAAFLLLEVQNISKAAVVLGNTWVVNAVIISGILIMVLLANMLAAKKPNLPLVPIYLLLIGSCLALYFVDLASFAFLPYFSKALLVGSLTTLPLFFSGLIFVRSYALMPNKHYALGANLIGALVGALLQSLTFVIGIKALLLVVAGLYALAVATAPKPSST